MTTLDPILGTGDDLPTIETTRNARRRVDRAKPSKSRNVEPKKVGTARHQQLTLIRFYEIMELVPHTFIGADC